MTLNTADRKSIRAAEKASRVADRERGEVIISIASTSAGRRYLWEKLESAHIFTTSWHDSPGRMAFLEGERNTGLQLLNDIIRWCPDEFILMMREHNVRHELGSSSASERSSGEDSGRDDQGSGDDASDSNDDPYRDAVDNLNRSVN
jgi:hypothetical protein